MENKKRYDGGCISVKIIELYYANKLSEEETRLFEEHITDCPFCSDAFDAYDVNKQSEIKKKLSEINSEISHKKRAASNWKLAFYSSAAAILIFALSFLFQNGYQTSGDKLFEKYFTPYPDVTLHIRGEQDNSKLKNAMRQYDAGNYAKASRMFDEILSEEECETARFYNGVANLEIGNNQRAIDLLKPVADNENSEFYAEANWYLALTYLRIDETGKAMERFKRLLNNPDYKKKARKLIYETSRNE